MNQSTNKRLRIAKFTLDGYFNYGNILQSYALQQVLLKYAETVDTIWTQPDGFLPKTWWKWNWKTYIKYILNWYNLRSRIHSGKIGLEMVRQARMRDFVDRYISYYRQEKDLAKAAEQYDFCVVGSDQVWNPHFGNYHQFFLGFASPEKRISYAASISTPKIPEEELDFFRKGLMEMKTLSLREHAGAELVEKLIGRKAEVHVDPTLLLSADEWRKVSRRPTWYHGEPYLLTYFLGPMPNEVRELAKKLGLAVVNLLDESNYEHYVTGVDEFLWAIEHAEFIYTDSFHGTVFSIIFRRPFVVCDRMANNPKDMVSGKMSSRIDTLLQYFGLEARRGTAQNAYQIADPLHITYPGFVDDVFAREQKRADEYLRKAMNLA